MTNFKNEHIDSLARSFNSADQAIKDSVQALIGSWDESELHTVINTLKIKYDSFQQLLKSLFVEIRLNILLLNEKDKTVYHNYCQITLRGLNEPISPQKIEETLYKNFGDRILTFEESFYSADINVSKEIDFYEASNYVFCYSLLLSYYYSLIIKIVDNIPVASYEDDDLKSLDKGKNTINQKALLLYYLIQDKKISLNKISQDSTKQARIFSFLFDNGYDNLRKGLGNINQSNSAKLKTPDNLNKVSILVSGLGSEYESISRLILEDLKSINSKS